MLARGCRDSDQRIPRSRMAAAVVDVDAVAAQSAEMTVEETKEEKIDKRAFSKFFNKKDMKAFNEAEGKDLVTDGRAVGLAAAVVLLEERITAHRNDAKKCKRPEMWDFNAGVLQKFTKSRTELLHSYLRWSIKEGIPKEDQEEFEAAATFNVDKAFRRVLAYAEWMQDHKAILDKCPFNAEHFRKGYIKTGNFCPDITDSSGRLMWIVDCLRGDEPPKLAVEMLILQTCYSMHCLAFDMDSQRTGIVILEDMAYMGFGTMMKVFPMDAKKEIDILFQGVSPVRMHKFCIVRSPMWMTLIMKFMGMFMSKKMKARMGVYGKDFDKLVAEVGGPEYMPAGFASGGSNTTCKDRFFGHEFPWPNRINKSVAAVQPPAPTEAEKQALANTLAEEEDE